MCVVPVINERFQYVFQMYTAGAFDQHELRPVGLPYQSVDTWGGGCCVGKDVGQEPGLNRSFGKLRSVLTNRHQGVRRWCEPGDIGPDLFVPRLADCPEFEHIAQDEDQSLTGMPNRIGGLERVLHGGRIRIIAIVQHGEVVGWNGERGETAGRPLGGP